MGIAQKLKNFRNEKGFSQQDIAIFLDISDNTYRKLENGINSPDFDTIEKLSKFYEKSILDFLPDENISINQNNESGSTVYSAFVYNQQVSDKLIELIKKCEEEKNTLVNNFLNKIEQLLNENKK